jgi:hypothetical protein
MMMMMMMKKETMIAVPEGDPKIKNDNNVEVDIAKGNGKSREVVDDEGNKAEEIENGKRRLIERMLMRMQWRLCSWLFSRLKCS